MSRIARVVAPGYPHHVTQRGNRRQRTFFNDGDYLLYLELMKEWCEKCGVEIWSYCLMPNHAHLVAVPREEGCLRQALGNAHWHYTGRINAREGWKGCLWQGRFASYVMDEPYLLAAVRYIELNPVRAGLVKHPAEYRWSSARSRITGQPNLLARPERLNDILAMYPAYELCEEDIEKIQKHSSTGRPLGGEEFMAGLESKLGRSLAKGRPGPRPKNHEISSVSP